MCYKFCVRVLASSQPCALSCDKRQLQLIHNVLYIVLLKNGNKVGLMLNHRLESTMVFSYPQTQPLFNYFTDVGSAEHLVSTPVTT